MYEETCLKIQVFIPSIQNFIKQNFYNLKTAQHLSKYFEVSKIIILIAESVKPLRGIFFKLSMIK